MGVTNGSNSKQVWASLDQCETWIQKPNVPFSERHNFALFVLDGSIFVIGG